MVNVTTRQCRKAFRFVVEEQFDLKSQGDCSLAPALEVGSSFLALGEIIEKNEYALDSSNHETSYIVAGVHRQPPEGCDDAVLWEVSDGVISEWKKNHDKKMSGWVENGNEERSCS